MANNKLHQNLMYFVIIVLVMLASCQFQTIPTQSDISPTLNLSPTSSTTLIPSQTPSQQTPYISPISAPQYQLTFVAECRENTQCMYALDVGCLETQQPCIGESKILFEVSKNSRGPKPPIFPYDWSPDGLQVVIGAVGIRGKSDIFIGSWDGQNWVNLTNSQTYEGSPVWSPDGLSITYIANSGEPNYYVRPFVIRLDDNKIFPLLSTLSTLDFPGVGHLYWASNGKHVAFAHSDEQGDYQLFVANPDGSNLRQLTYEEKNYGLHGFSPDGYWLLYTQEIRTDFDNIYRIRFDGSEKVAITDDIEGFKTDLTWSPIGDWIAFASNIKGSYDIYVIRSDGTGLLNVTESTIDESAPAWRVISH